MPGAAEGPLSLRATPIRSPRPRARARRTKPSPLRARRILQFSSRGEQGGRGAGTRMAAPHELPAGLLFALFALPRSPPLLEKTGGTGVGRTDGHTGARVRTGGGQPGVRRRTRAPYWSANRAPGRGHWLLQLRVRFHWTRAATDRDRVRGGVAKTPIATPTPARARIRDKSGEGRDKLSQQHQPHAPGAGAGDCSSCSTLTASGWSCNPDPMSRARG